MAVAELAAKKKALVQELNSFIAQKKALSEQASERAALICGGKGTAGPKGKEGTLKEAFTLMAIHDLSAHTDAVPDLELVCSYGNG